MERLVPYLKRLLSNDVNLPQLRELLDRVEDINRQYYAGFTLLHLAADSREDNVLVVQVLINAGADVNMKNHFGFTALHFAVAHRKRMVVRVLIDSGISVNDKNLQGDAALHYAVTKVIFTTPPIGHGNPFDAGTIAELLKHEDIDCNLTNSRGLTPLMMAVNYRERIAVKKLLSKHANPNICNKSSDTPLHRAFSNRSYVIGMQLLNGGASIYAVNASGFTPVDILMKNMVSTIESLPILKLIALKYNVTYDLKGKFRFIPELLKFFDKCCHEVNKMRTDFISGNITVHDFILNCFNEDHFQDFLLQIYKPLVDRLVRNMYDAYCIDLLKKIPLSSLLDVLQITAWSKTRANSNTIIDLAYLLSKRDITHLIGEYLFYKDIFRTTVALSNFRIKASKEN